MTEAKPVRKSSLEWSLNDSPILLPIAFEPREMNAARVAFFLAEYSGSKVIIVHVKSPYDDVAKKEISIALVEKLAKRLGVKYELEEIPVTWEPSLDEISRILASEAERINCQVIVMSAHREAFFTELFGRVSDRVARTSVIPVILVETPRDGMIIPDLPAKMLIPILADKLIPGPFIVASALTSTASAAHAEIIATRVIEVPQTLPLDVVRTSDEMRDAEKVFSLMVSTAIKSLGRIFSPKILPVRDIGPDVAEFAKDQAIDIIIVHSSRGSGYAKLLKKAEYEIVKRAPCISLVMLSPSRG